MHAEDFLAKTSGTDSELTNFQLKTFLVVDVVVSMRASLRNHAHHPIAFTPGSSLALTAGRQSARQ